MTGLFVTAHITAAIIGCFGCLKPGADTSGSGITWALSGSAFRQERYRAGRPHESAGYRAGRLHGTAQPLVATSWCRASRTPLPAPQGHCSLRRRALED